MSSRTIQRALLSVSDKSGIVELAKQLELLNVEILATGGTAKLLQENNIKIIEISDYTGFPEIMDGRVKTLHPKVHAGLLARPRIDDEILATHKIGAIDLLAVNLYPFTQTIQKPNCDLATAIENIDIGGPAMLRAAAKNYTAVTVMSDPDDYMKIIAEIQGNNGCTQLETRFYLAKKIFAHTANYDAAIANYLTNIDSPLNENIFPEKLHLEFSKKEELRYGENPHQRACFYIESHLNEPSIASATQHQGKPLSFNNIADSDAALECVKNFKDNSACVIVKHANPCGVAIGNTQQEAYERAFSTDPTSAFGGIIAFNQTLNEETASAILNKQFVEVIIAPEISNAALIVLQQKPNVRVLSCGHWSQLMPSQHYQRVTGGLLVQDRDMGEISADELQIVSKRAPTAQEYNDLLFAWKIVKHVKSNAIVYAKNNLTIGIGAGQMSRVNSVRIAAIKAQEADLKTQGAVMASDAFFPFRDGIDLAAQAGITAIIQPGGSIKDNDIIAAANEMNIAMIFTGMRHFKH